MNYASDLPAMFIHEIVHIKMLKLLKVFKRLGFPLLKNDYTLLANAGGQTPQFNMGCQVQNGPIHKEESIRALNNSSCPVQVLQLLSCASSVCSKQRLEKSCRWENRLWKVSSAEPASDVTGPIHALVLPEQSQKGAEADCSLPFPLHPLSS